MAASPPDIVGPASVGTFASEVKRSEVSHEDAKAPRFAGRVRGRALGHAPTAGSYSWK